NHPQGWYHGCPGVQASAMAAPVTSSMAAIGSARRCFRMVRYLDSAVYRQGGCASSARYDRIAVRELSRRTFARFSENDLGQRVLSQKDQTVRVGSCSEDTSSSEAYELLTLGK